MAAKGAARRISRNTNCESGVFLPFLDETNRSETYGGGRYLLDTIKGADLGREGERLVIDFNYAYNPSCAYNSRWQCPLAPQENWLPAEKNPPRPPLIRGERTPRPPLIRGEKILAQ